MWLDKLLYKTYRFLSKRYDMPILKENVLSRLVADDTLRCGPNALVYNHGSKVNIKVGTGVVLDGILECYEKGELTIGDYSYVGRSRIFAARRIEAARVLRPGGMFLMTREHVISRASDLQAFLDSHPLHSRYGGENAYLLEEYLRSIELSGLRIKKVIGPYESPINFAPMTVADFSALIASKYFGVLGKILSQKISAMKSVQSWCGRKLSMESDEPGRLYTFLAVK